MVLSGHGFVVEPGPFARPQDAWSAARVLVDEAAALGARLAVVGDFVIPPPDGPPSRDFQTLHFDFGLPLAPVAPADVARFTALHVAIDAVPGDAVTRLVPLRSLLAGGPWPNHDGWSGGLPCTETAMERGTTPPATSRAVWRGLSRPRWGRRPLCRASKKSPNFSAGPSSPLSLRRRPSSRNAASVLDIVGTEVCLRPGELLVFDNLALAHGRRGARRPGELNQRVFGHRALAVDQQVELRDRVLAAFSS